MIKLNNVSKSFMIKEGVINVLSGVSFDFRSGFYGISGRSGIGKTTILSLIGLLDSPTSGTIEIDGNVVDESNVKMVRSKYISFVFQRESLLRGYSVHDNLRLISDNEDKIDKILKLVRLDDAQLAYPDELSGGEKQRIAFARTLLEDRPVILLDEPTGNLDKKNARIILDILKEESKNKLIIMVSHDTKILDEYSDVRLTIKDGSLIVESDNCQKTRSFDNVSKRVLNKSLLFKREALFRPFSFILNLFASIILTTLITISSYSVFYSTRSGAKHNAEVGDLIMPCLDISIGDGNEYSSTKIIGGKSINDSIKSSLQSDNYNECVIVDRIPVIFDDTASIKPGEIIIPEHLINDESSEILYKIGETLSFAGQTYTIAGTTIDPCFRVASSDKDKIYDYKRDCVSFMDSKAVGESGGMSIFNESLRFNSTTEGVMFAPASDIGAVLSTKQAIFRGRSFEGQTFSYLDGLGLDPKFFDTTFDMRIVFPNGIDYIDPSSLDIQQDIVDDYRFYVNDDVYNFIRKYVSNMDVSQYVLINDNASVIDFIVDNCYDIYQSPIEKDSVSRLAYYLMNSGDGISLMKGLSDGLFFGFSVGYILFISIIIVNTTKERRYVLGLLDIGGCSRWFSVSAINIKTIISSFICFLIGTSICISGVIISLVNKMVMNLGFAANFLYFSIPSIVFVGVILLAAPVLGIVVSLLRLRKMKTKNIFDYDE